MLPPNPSPPHKKVKENNTSQEEEDLEKRMEALKRPKDNQPEANTSLVTKLQNKIEDLERFLTASGEVIANLEEENNQLQAKAEFYEEDAEDLTIEN